jgi:hypothetical protein
VARRRLTVVAAAACVALIPWTIFLAVTLPRHYEAHHWRLTWVGLDVAMAFFLARTAWLAYRRQRGLVISAVVTGTLLCVDAWFDVVTANQADRMVSLATAVFGEIPLAAVLFLAARRVLHALHHFEIPPEIGRDLPEGETDGVADGQDHGAGARHRQ